LVVWRNKTNKKRVIWGGVVFFVFALLPYRLFIYQTPAEKTFALEQEAQRIEYKAKYEAAKPIFDKLCKEQSAPIIKRTVEDVEGVLLLKVRPSVNGQFDRFLADQMWAGAALPMERKADSGYAEYFLFDRRWVEWGSRSPGRQWRVVPEIGKAGQRGFQFVDLLQSDGKTRLRVTARSDAKAQEEPVSGIAYTRTPAVTPPPRYAVSYEDNVDLELRRHWIAGTTVLVIDTNTNEVIGQQSFWNWDQGFGARTGGRSPWGAARAQCPLDGNGDKQTHLFVDKVLKPIKGD